MQIIIDRKKKRKYLMMDADVKDPLGVDEARRSKQNEIQVDMAADNPIDKFLRDFDHKALLGHTAFCLRDDKSVISGRIVDVYPSRMILVRRGNGDRVPWEFEKVIVLQ